MKKRLIKKYPNRRLYDTQSSSYITLSDVKSMVIDNQPVSVVDAKSEQDLTRSILLQIILEEEAGGQPLFTEAMLEQMIRFYGHAMQSIMGSYMEKSVQAFVDMQERLSLQSKALFDSQAPGGGPFPQAEQWAQFLQMQSPMMQGFMNNYIEQSKNMFVQMQSQMQQSSPLWPGFPSPAPDAKSPKK
jgi:polyhydroxyalkanoate synthesis repressor PhaR